MISVCHGKTFASALSRYNAISSMQRSAMSPAIEQRLPEFSYSDQFALMPVKLKISLCYTFDKFFFVPGGASFVLNDIANSIRQSAQSLPIDLTTERIKYLVITACFVLILIRFYLES